MEGFFSKKEIQSITALDGKVRSCYSCGLYVWAKTPKMKPYGNFRKRIMNIAEAPGETEDLHGKPFQGKAGKLLQKTYKKLGIDLFEDCINLNAVNCRPISKTGSNRTPTNYEIECCRKSVFQYIEKYKPHTIVLLGSSAIQSILNHRWKKDFGGISKWRGWAIPDQSLRAWICPVFHPSFILRYESCEYVNLWEDDLMKAFETVNMGFPVVTEPNIKIITDLNILNEIQSGVVSIDFETTGLKPYKYTDHRIVSASVATDENTAYVFKIPNKRSEMQPFKKLLANPNVRKSAHNIKFEDVWSKIYLDTTIRGWLWDSMQAAHIIDNRSHITGLKFQTYVNFGIIDYSSEINKYLQSVDEKNGNSVNRIDELISTESGLQKLLKYNALDTIYQYRLSNKQMKLFA